MESFFSAGIATPALTKGFLSDVFGDLPQLQLGLVLVWHKSTFE